jgi:hypothetical protein
LWKTIHWILLIFGIGLFSAIVIIAMMIDRSLSRPVYDNARMYEHARNRGVLCETFNAQPLAVRTEDGISLAALLIVRPQAERVLLICHGYKMAKERLLTFAYLFPNDTLCLFDYRAHGESEGEYTSIGYHEKKDVLAFLSLLERHDKTSHLPIVGIGLSMGAVSLLAAAANNPVCKALVLDSPFVNLERQAEKMLNKKYNLPSFPFAHLGRFISRHRHFPLDEVNAYRWLATIKVPTLFIHSTCDATADFEDVQEMYKTFNLATKDFWIVEGSGHARIVYDFPEQYRDRVQQFLGSII